MEYPVTYSNAIRRHYNQLKEKKSLNPNMRRASPGNLRKECVIRFNENLSKEDKLAFASFFEESVDRVTLEVMKGFPLVQFRPMSKFVNKKNDSPDLKTIELLACLIDFSLRPYQEEADYDKCNPDEEGRETVPKGDELETGFTNLGSLGNQQQVTKPENSEKKETISEETDKGETDRRETGTKENPKPRAISKVIGSIAAASLLTVIGFWGFGYFKKDMPDSVVYGNAQCMYWTGDHFEPIPCNQKVKNTTILALDTFRLKNFRRVTTPDTISRWSIGRLWYCKKNNQLQYFTHSGEHPEYPDSKIRVLSEYMFDKYLQPKMVGN